MKLSMFLTRVILVGVASLLGVSYGYAEDGITTAPTGPVESATNMAPPTLPQSMVVANMVINSINVPPPLVVAPPPISAPSTVAPPTPSPVLDIGVLEDVLNNIPVPPVDPNDTLGDPGELIPGDPGFGIDFEEIIAEAIMDALDDGMPPVPPTAEILPDAAPAPVGTTPPVPVPGPIPPMPAVPPPPPPVEAPPVEITAVPVVPPLAAVIVASAFMMPVAEDLEPIPDPISTEPVIDPNDMLGDPGDLIPGDPGFDPECAPPPPLFPDDIQLVDTEEMIEATEGMIS